MSCGVQYVKQQREMVSGPIQPGQSFQDGFPLSESAQVRDASMTKQRTEQGTIVCYAVAKQ